MALIHTLSLERLSAAMKIVVRGFGSEEAEVDAVVGNLIDANLTGHDSHGIGMLPRYAEAFVEGGLFPNRHVKAVADAGTLLRLDGQAGFGQVVGREAMALGIGRAREHGSCIVALGNAHHIGRIGAWAEQAAAAGLISIHLVNVVARNVVAPFGGGDARFGTNPVCIGVPLPGREPVILDFATSMIAQGKTRVAHNKGEPVPPGCLIDDQGRDTTNPRYSVIPPWGALLTFGAHKGYGLAVMCELLGGALAGGLTQRNADASRRRVLNGMFSVLLDPASLGPTGDFEREAAAFVDWVKASPPREGVDQVLVAGEPERASRAHRSAHGIPVDATTWQEILEAGRKLGIDPGAVNAAAGIG
jgi:uncharacterized oxidoreductase